MEDRERRRLEQKIAALEHRIQALTTIVRTLASAIESKDPAVSRSVYGTVDQMLNAELATRPR